MQFHKRRLTLVCAIDLWDSAVDNNISEYGQAIFHECTLTTESRCRKHTEGATLHYVVSWERRKGSIGNTRHPHKALAQERNRIEQRKGNVVNLPMMWSDEPACQKWRRGRIVFAVRKYIKSRAEGGLDTANTQTNYNLISKGVDFVMQVETKTMATTSRTAESEPIKLLKRVGSTTYLVNVRFRATSAETLEDKVLRLIESEVSKGDS